jgi:proteasome lid subunit RPN8/RPN11
MLELDRVTFDDLVEHGLAAFPNEACGLLAGKEARPVKFFAMTNRDASPVSYRLDSTELLHAYTEMDDEGWDLLAIFHTHTHSEAYPSETDVRQAFFPGATELGPLFPDAVYLVMSLSDRANPDLRGFTISAEGVTEVEVRVA